MKCGNKKGEVQKLTWPLQKDRIKNFNTGLAGLFQTRQDFLFK